VLIETIDAWDDEPVGLEAVEIKKRTEHFVDSFTHRMRTGN